MKLSKYLDLFSWSKKDLARKASVSTNTVNSALEGKPIARRSAQAIIEALQMEHERLKMPGRITKASIEGLRTSNITRKKKKSAEEEKPIEGGDKRTSSTGSTDMKIPGPVRKSAKTERKGSSILDINKSGPADLPGEIEGQ